MRASLRRSFAVALLIVGIVMRRSSRRLRVLSIHSDLLSAKAMASFRLTKRGYVRRIDLSGRTDRRIERVRKERTHSITPNVGCFTIAIICTTEN